MASQSCAKVKLRNGTTTKREAKRYSGLRIHDLRHLYGQLASDAGAPTAKIQVALRHADPKMTRRYEMRRAKGEVAQLVGRELTGGANGANSAHRTKAAQRLARAIRRTPPRDIARDRGCADQAQEAAKSVM